MEMAITSYPWEREAHPYQLPARLGTGHAGSANVASDGYSGSAALKLFRRASGRRPGTAAVTVRRPPRHARAASVVRGSLPSLGNWTGITDSGNRARAHYEDHMPGGASEVIKVRSQFGNIGASSGRNTAWHHCLVHSNVNA
jgi:hypothetical protein